ncbi:MAG: acyltransferase [Paracoccus sp. (in: a-proteobacteria)]|uniref:acyltransferase family protein n=1 Tax=Paracoccus sp. TaxID=267 RepID=UPI0039E5F149
MPSLFRGAAPLRPGHLPIETVRAIAIILLVSFHVIGGAEQQRGLGVSYPHPLRYYADLLVDLRMPLFAFVAGVVYGLKPVQPEKLGAFLKGKLRRLALPGITAITVFMLMARAMGAPDGQILSHPWDAYLRHYTIFWFLQVMLVIFATYGTLDVLTRGRVLMPVLALSLLAVAMGWGFESDIMALNRITHLLAYFLLGLAFIRHLDWIGAHRGAVALSGLAMLGLGLAMNLHILHQTGAFSDQRLDLQSLLFGAGAAIAGFLLLPRLSWLQWLGAYSLTIYLYHILATSMSRRVLEKLGIESPWLLVLGGTALGIGLPVLLHLLSSRFALTRLLVLGLRDKSAPRQGAAVPA